MNRSSQGLEIILGLLLGLFLGLATSWWIAPNAETDFSPAALRSDYKDEYRLLVASAYVITNDLGRSQMRLTLLKDDDVVQSLIDQAMRQQTGQTHSDLFPETPEENVYALALLANAIERSSTGLDSIPSETMAPARPVPSATPLPYELISQETLCDPDITISLARISVRNDTGLQQPGVEILVTWEGGQQRFFTGLKPVMGNGYADFIMEPGISYTLQIMPSSLPISNLSAPDCTMEDGTIYKGGYFFQFQQP